MKGCKEGHKYVHVDTIRKEEDRYVMGESPVNIRYSRVDKYYCERCLNTVDKSQVVHASTSPDWF